MLALCLLALVQGDSYSTRFQAGLDALEAGRPDAAIVHFESAGELAEQAPLWKLYARHAAGTLENGSPSQPASSASLPAAEPPGAGPPQAETWEAVGPSGANFPRISRDGSVLLAGGTLWDLVSGERIAKLKYRLPGTGRYWSLEESGRFVIGAGKGRSFHDFLGLDVRELRSGEPVEVPGAESIVTSYGSTYEFLPADAPADTSPWYETVDLTMEGGKLRIRSFPAEPNRDIRLDLERRRGTILWRRSPATLQLFDLDEAVPLAELTPGGFRATHSPDGSLVATQEGLELVLLDARSGERLPAPVITGAANSREWSFAFRAGHVVTATAAGELMEWDPREACVVRRTIMDPPLSGWISLIGCRDQSNVVLASASNTTYGYDLESGDRLWELAGRDIVPTGLGPGGRSFAVGRSFSLPQVVDTLSGEPLIKQPTAPFRSNHVLTVPGTEQALVEASDGRIRLIELADGSTVATAEEHRGQRLVQMQVLPEDRLLTHDAAGLVVHRRAGDLSAIEQVRLGTERRIVSLDHAGARALLQREEGRASLLSLWEDTDEIPIELDGQRIKASAWSPSGELVAFAHPGAIEIRRTRDGAVVQSLSTERYTDVKPLAFHREDILCVGHGDGRDGGLGKGLDIYEVASGRRIAGHKPRDMFSAAGWASDILSDPVAGTVLYTVQSSGFAIALDDQNWKPMWSVDFSGGNPSRLSLQRWPGAPRTFVSGMTDTHARVLGSSTGKLLAKARVEGCYSLQSTESGAFVVAVRKGNLVVFRGKDLHELYERSEGTGTSAWILKDGSLVRRVGGQPDPEGQRHLIRDGLSRPLDCWDPWLLDPLELGVTDLAKLPEPAHILSGPARRVRAQGDSYRAPLVAGGQDGLLGVRVEVAGRAPEFQPLSSEDSLQARIQGPWPADVSLRLISSNGTASAPWRLRIE